MEELLEKLYTYKKQIISDGHLSDKEVEGLRELLFADEMSKEKGNFLFELKDLVAEKKRTSNFEKLFVDAISVLLIVSFFKHSLDVPFENAKDLLLLSLGVVLIALSLFIANKATHK